jgi:hypothetical protein
LGADKQYGPDYAELSAQMFPSSKGKTHGKMKIKDEHVRQEASILLASFQF